MSIGIYCLECGMPTMIDDHDNYACKNCHSLRVITINELAKED